MKNRMILVVAFLFAVCFASFVNAAEMEYKTQQAVIVAVENGNTVSVRFVADNPNGDVRVAKLKGVVASWKGDEGACFAEASQQFLADVLFQEDVKEVTVEWDSGDKIDSKGNLLVYLSLDSLVDVNAVILFRGHGWVARMFPADRKEDYLALEQLARADRQGLWKTCPEEFLSKLPH